MDQPETKTTDLREFVTVIRARKWSVLIVTLLVTSVALGLAYRRPALYASIATIEVRPQFIQVQQSTVTAFVNMDTERVRVTAQPVAERAAATMGVDVATANGLKQLTDRVSVSVPTNTTYLDITCTKSLPVDAQACAQAFADAYREDRLETARQAYDAARKAPLQQITQANRQIQTLTAELAVAPASTQPAIQSQIDQAQTDSEAARLQLLQIPAPASDPAVVALPAYLPQQPANKGFITTGALALILGLALGIGLAFVRERLDERVAVGENLERALGAPTLATIPHVQSWRNRNEARTVTITEADSPTAEAYRAARTSLLFVMRETEFRVIEITGPGQSEGKTTTTANLAVALAKGGKRVIAISCDLRKPRLHRFFGLDNSVGVSSALSGEASLDDALVQTDIPNLRVMTSGPIPGNPAELLGSSAMDDLLSRLRKEADIVLIDTPPALVVSDALELAPKVDGILLIADAGLSTRGSIGQARQRLERAGGTIIGGILNDFDPSKGRRHRHGYGYGGLYRPYKYRGEEPGPEMQPAMLEPETNGHEPGATGSQPADAQEWRTTSATAASRQQNPHRQQPSPGAQNPDQ